MAGKAKAQAAAVTSGGIVPPPPPSIPTYEVAEKMEFTDIQVVHGRVCYGEASGCPKTFSGYRDYRAHVLQLVKQKQTSKV